MPCLISNGGHVLEFQQLPSRFGTSQENEIVVQPGLGVAAHHFVLTQENGHLVLESTGQGATSVNGNSVRRTGIRDGDRIQVGELMLVFSEHARPSEPVTAATDHQSMVGMNTAPDTPLSAGNSGIQGTTAPSSGGPAHEAVSDALSTLSHTTQSPFQPSSAEGTPNGPAPAQAETPVRTASPGNSPPPSEASQPDNSFEAWLASSQAAFDGSGPNPNASPSTEAQASSVTPNPPPPGSDQSDLNAETEDLAAIFQAANDAEERPPAAAEEGDDLAGVFLTADSGADGTEAKAEETDIAQEKVIEAIDIEIPALPEIEEAEKSGATVTAAHLPGNAIKPSGMGAKARTKPLPPIRMGTDEDEEAPEGPGSSEGSKAIGSRPGSKRRRWSWRTRQSAPLDEATQAQRVTAKALDRLAKTNRGPRYQRWIPWHQVGLAACLIFAAAGAYLAIYGQHHVERTLNMLGFATESGHSDYVSRLSFMEPEALVTVDVERAIDLYKRWSKSEDWLTIGNLNDALDQFAEGFSLTDLERVTLSMDAQGRTLALLSSKREWTRRDLVRDLGRGLLSLERVGDLSVHEGFLGRRTEIKFALLNPKTLVIGDPELTTKFLSAPEAAPTGQLIDRPAHALAKTTRDWLGFYVAQSSWERLKSLLPESIKPTADRVLAYVQSSTAENGRLLGRIGVDVSVHADFDFASPHQATQFAEGWGTMAQERLAELMNLMGPHGKALIGAQTDLKRCKIKAENQRASLALSVANRWATLDTLSVKSTFLEIAKVLQTDPNPAPSLMTPDELEARETAHQIAYKYERGLEAGAKELEGINDLETIVKTLANGVRGSGAYRNVTYRVPSAKKLLPRVVELLEWTDTGKVTVNPVPETVSAKVDGKTLMSKNEADESPEEP